MDITAPGTTSFELFIGTSLALLLTPGPAVLYLVGRSIEHGRLAGIISVLGIHTATLVQVAAAALGLSALLASSALAFDAVKYAGAAYLVWLGLSKMLGRIEAADAVFRLRRCGTARLFRDGFVVSLFNPNTVLFFLAFLPQFVDASRGDVTMQIASLGVTFTALGILSNGCYALAAGTAGNWLKHRRGYLTAERYVSGALFIALGVAAAFSDMHGK